MHLNQLNKQGLDQKLLEQTFDQFLSNTVTKPRGEYFIYFHIRRNTLIAVIFSLLLHALIFFYAPKINFDVPPTPPATSIEVSLAPHQPLAPPAVESITEVLPEQPVSVKEKPKVIAKKPTKPALMLPDVIAVPQPSVESLPKAVVEKEAVVEEKFTDMAAYVRAMQERRQGSEYSAARQNAEAAARERGPSEEQVRAERIKRNFQNGTNGIFEITSLGSRNATFVFRGWTNDFSISKRQFFEVEASSGQDVRLVMVKRMIALIREHYQGDFNWQSHRLGRSVVQSARLEDNAGLEDFMMMEFFGTHYKSASQ